MVRLRVLSHYFILLQLSLRSTEYAHVYNMQLVFVIVIAILLVYALHACQYAHRYKHPYLQPSIIAGHISLGRLEFHVLGAVHKVRHGLL